MYLSVSQLAPFSYAKKGASLGSFYLLIFSREKRVKLRIKQMLKVEEGEGLCFDRNSWEEISVINYVQKLL